MQFEAVHKSLHAFLIQKCPSTCHNLSHSEYPDPKIMSRIDYPPPPVPSVIFLVFSTEMIHYLSSFEHKFLCIFQPVKSVDWLSPITQYHPISLGASLQTAVVFILIETRYRDEICANTLHDLIRWPCCSLLTIATLYAQGICLRVVPKCKLQTASRKFLIAAPSIWNDLPIHIRSSVNLISFLEQLTTHFFYIAYN